MTSFRFWALNFKRDERGRWYSVSRNFIALAQQLVTRSFLSVYWLFVARIFVEVTFFCRIDITSSFLNFPTNREVSIVKWTAPELAGSIGCFDSWSWEVSKYHLRRGYKPSKVIFNTAFEDNISQSANLDKLNEYTTLCKIIYNVPIFIDYFKRTKLLSPKIFMVLKLNHWPI